jgi:hypothetical protein
MLRTAEIKYFQASRSVYERVELLTGGVLAIVGIECDTVTHVSRKRGHATNGWVMPFRWWSEFAAKGHQRTPYLNEDYLNTFCKVLLHIKEFDEKPPMQIVVYTRKIARYMKIRVLSERHLHRSRERIKTASEVRYVEQCRVVDSLVWQNTHALHSTVSKQGYIGIVPAATRRG